MVRRTPYTPPTPGPQFGTAIIPNAVRMVRNPNSPSAIMARQSNLPDPTPADRIELITDKTAGTILIDLTTNSVDQRVGYVMTGGGRKNKKFVKNIVGSKNGRLTITSYFMDVDNKQWIIIRGYGNEPQPDLNDFGGQMGVPGVSAPGENWRNQGRSVDRLIENTNRQYGRMPVDPNTNQSIINPVDEFLDDFTGNA